MASGHKRFHDHLRELRESANQTPDVMAVLLNITLDEYKAMEDGRAYPDNETLKRLCTVAEWNYYDAQRMIINNMASANVTPSRSAEGDAAVQALQGFPLEKQIGLTQRPDTLGNRLKDVRQRTGQSVDIIAMLLGIEPEHYRSLEAGEAPGGNLLRRISIVYDWNYYDLQNLLRSEQAQALQPRRMGSPFPMSGAQNNKFKGVLSELETLFQRLPEKDQEYALTQLELVRNTMLHMQQAS